MYMFGDRNPEIAALLREQSFQQLVGQLFVAEEPGLPAELPLFWDDAVRLDLLASNGERYQAGRRLVLIPAVAERGVADLLRPALARYVEVAGEVGAELRAVYGQTAVAERFAWSQVSHSVLAGLFLDLAMGRSVLHSNRISRRPTGDTTIWAFQGISADNAYGVGAVPADPPHRALFAELWHHRTRRSEPRLSLSLVGALVRIAQGEPAGSVRELLYLKHLKLVRTVGRSLQLQVPAFAASDAERLLVPLTEGARRLVTDAILPALELLNRHPWWREGIRHEPCRHAAVRLILEYGIDRVISAGVCDPFPEAGDLPVAWGRWLWEEPEGPRTVMPHLASCQSEGSSLP